MFINFYRSQESSWVADRKGALIQVHTQTIEGLWMQAKRKLRYQSGTSNRLFRSYLSAFPWRFSHKEHVFGQLINLLSDNYNIYNLGCSAEDYPQIYSRIIH